MNTSVFSETSKCMENTICKFIFYQYFPIL